MKTTYQLVVSSLRPNTNFRKEVLLPCHTLETDEQLDALLKECEQNFQDGKNRLRYFLNIHVDGMFIGHAEAPTAEMLLEKIGTFERWLEKKILSEEDLSQYIITHC